MARSIMSSERRKMTKVVVRFRDGSRIVLSKDRWDAVKGYKHPITVLGKTIDPSQAISHDYYGQRRKEVDENN